MENLEILGSISLCIAAILVALIEVVFFLCAFPVCVAEAETQLPFLCCTLPVKEAYRAWSYYCGNLKRMH